MPNVCSCALAAHYSVNIEWCSFRSWSTEVVSSGSFFKLKLFKIQLNSIFGCDALVPTPEGQSL